MSSRVTKYPYKIHKTILIPYEADDKHILELVGEKSSTILASYPIVNKGRQETAYIIETTKHYEVD